MLNVLDYLHLHADHICYGSIDKADCGIDSDSFIECLKEKI